MSLSQCSREMSCICNPCQPGLRPRPWIASILAFGQSCYAPRIQLPILALKTNVLDSHSTWRPGSTSRPHSMHLWFI